jgi:hypothetical protein
MTPSRFHSAFPWLMLLSRTAFFALAQALIAAGFAVSGAADAWGASIPWWMACVTAGNVVSFLLLVTLFRSDGGSYWQLWRFERTSFWKDFALALGGLLIAGPIAMIPMRLLGNAIVGSYDAAVAVMFRPLPSWGLWLGLLFPLTIGFAELPTYFGYVMPRLERQLGSGWAAWAIASLGLSIQHAALPLIPDGRYLLWRATMYLPFALYIGLVIKWRPRLIPFLLIGHGLIDFGTWAVYFML